MTSLCWKFLEGKNMISCRHHAGYDAHVTCTKWQLEDLNTNLYLWNMAASSEVDLHGFSW